MYMYAFRSLQLLSTKGSVELSLVQRYIYLCRTSLVKRGVIVSNFYRKMYSLFV